jgi:hypothetical protein
MARRATEMLVFKVREEAPVEIMKGGSEDEGVDTSWTRATAQGTPKNLPEIF